MKINIKNCQVLSEDFTKHICVVVLNHYIELEKQIIDDNKDNAEVIMSSEKNLKHLKESKKYIKSFYKQWTESQIIESGTKLKSVL